MKKTTILAAVLSFSCIFTLIIVKAADVRAASHEINDVNITRAVERALEKDNSVSAHLIDVKTSNGIVTLSGTVGNILEKDLATQITMKVTGVRGINNVLSVAPTDKTDREIREHVKDALLFDPATETYEIDVSVKNKNVTLRGEVQSALEKLLAEYVTKNVRGVRGVTNRISVDYKLLRKDDEIEEEIKRGMKLNPYLDTDNIEISVKKGIVYIKGNVPSITQKARIRSRAMVNGVLAVDDSGVVVRPKDTEQAGKEKDVRWSGRQITENIESIFARSPRLSGYDIKVTADNGVVSLSGVTGSLKAKRTAESIAKNAGGVRSVKNRIKVRPEKTIDDPELVERIKMTLERDPYLYRYNIGTAVKNKKVYLDGKVNSRFEKKRAEEIVSRVQGVVAIDNRIRIDELWEWKLDREIMENIEDELFWDADLDSSHITVKVQDGVAFLSGMVNTYNDLKAARRNAFEGGAKAVVNNLTVVH